MTLRPVSREAFFEAIYADKRDIHPRCERDASFWEVQHSRVLVGKTMPGWSCEGPKAYFLVEA